LEQKDDDGGDKTSFEINPNSLADRHTKLTLFSVKIRKLPEGLPNFFYTNKAGKNDILGNIKDS